MRNVKLIFVLICCVIMFFVNPVHALDIDHDDVKEAYQDISQIEIQSDYAYLINLDDHTVLYEKQSEQKMFPASMTKIVTLYTALEHIKDLEEHVTITEEMLHGLKEANASVAGFQAGESFTIKDILYAIMLASGADATRAISMTLAEDEATFVEWMNEAVSSLGLDNSHFVNTTGLHDDEHYSTAKDMAIILEVALENPIFYEVFNTSTYQTSSTAQHPLGLTFYSTMRQKEADLGFDVHLITGGKTGFTEAAKQCLASYYKKDNTSYILITGSGPLKNSSIQDAHVIYDYIKEQYSYEKIVEQGEIISNINIKDSWTTSLEINTKEDIYVLLNQGMDIDKVEIVLIGPDIYQAPLSKNSKLGDLVVTYEGIEIKRIPYLLDKGIDKSIVVTCWNHIVHPIFIVSFLIITLITMYLHHSRKLIKLKKQEENRSE